MFLNVNEIRICHFFLSIFFLRLACGAFKGGFDMFSRKIGVVLSVVYVVDSSQTLNNAVT